MAFNMTGFGKLLHAVDAGRILARHGEDLDWGYIEGLARGGSFYPSLYFAHETIVKMFQFQTKRKPLPDPGAAQKSFFQMVWSPGRFGALTDRAPTLHRYRFSFFAHGTWSDRMKVAASVIAPRKDWVSGYFGRTSNPWLAFKFASLALRNRLSEPVAEGEKPGRRRKPAAKARARRQNRFGAALRAKGLHASVRSGIVIRATALGKVREKVRGKVRPETVLERVHVTGGPRETGSGGTLARGATTVRARVLRATADRAAAALRRDARGRAPTIVRRRLVQPASTTGGPKDRNAGITGAMRNGTAGGMKDGTRDPFGRSRCSEERRDERPVRPEPVSEERGAREGAPQDSRPPRGRRRRWSSGSRRGPEDRARRGSERGADRGARPDETSAPKDDRADDRGAPSEDARALQNGPARTDEPSTQADDRGSQRDDRAARQDDAGARRDDSRRDDAGAGRDDGRQEDSGARRDDSRTDDAGAPPDDTR